MIRISIFTSLFFSMLTAEKGCPKYFVDIAPGQRIKNGNCILILKPQKYMDAESECQRLRNLKIIILQKRFLRQYFFRSRNLKIFLEYMVDDSRDLQAKKKIALSHRFSLKNFQLKFFKTRVQSSKKFNNEMLQTIIINYHTSKLLLASKRIRNS